MLGHQEYLDTLVSNWRKVQAQFICGLHFHVDTSHRRRMRRRAYAKDERGVERIPERTSTAVTATSDNKGVPVSRYYQEHIGPNSLAVTSRLPGSYS